MEAELVGDLSDRHGLREILLVSKDEEDSVAELILGQHLVELVVGLGDTLAVVRVDNEDETLGVLEVVPPERTDLVLASHIPHGEVDVLVLDRLDVEADGGDRRHDLTELQLVQDGGLTGGIETNHQNPHVLLAEQAAEKLCERGAHLPLSFVFAERITERKQSVNQSSPKQSRKQKQHERNSECSKAQGEKKPRNAKKRIAVQ